MRESLKYASKHFKGKLVKAVEIGVAAGKNADCIRKSLRISDLFLIDSWREDYGEGKAPEWLLKTKRKFESDRRVWIFIQDAIKATEFFPTEQIDYLYLDDSHNPEHLYHEIYVWWDKVKPGGIIAGHDYGFDEKGRARKGVLRFCKEHNVTHFFKKNDNEDVCDWWIVKPAIS